MFNFFVILIVLIFALFAYCAILETKLKRKYGITQKGGWGGFITYKNNGKSSEIEWERLAGGDNFILYNEKLKWASPENDFFTDKDKQLFYKNFNAWAEAKKYNYEMQIMDEK